jgi:hypothetical protein
MGSIRLWSILAIRITMISYKSKSKPIKRSHKNKLKHTKQADQKPLGLLETHMNQTM